MKAKEMVFCPHVEIVEHQFLNGDAVYGYQERYTVKCLHKVCPFTRQNVVCLSHNNGLFIISEDAVKDRMCLSNDGGE